MVGKFGGEFLGNDVSIIATSQTKVSLTMKTGSCLKSPEQIWLVIKLTVG